MLARRFAPAAYALMSADTHLAPRAIANAITHEGQLRRAAVNTARTLHSFPKKRLSVHLHTLRTAITLAWSCRKSDKNSAIRKTRELSRNGNKHNWSTCAPSKSSEQKGKTKTTARNATETPTHRPTSSRPRTKRESI